MDRKRAFSSCSLRIIILDYDLLIAEYYHLTPLPKMSILVINVSVGSMCTIFTVCSRTVKRIKHFDCSVESVLPDFILEWPNSNKVVHSCI